MEKNIYADQNMGLIENWLHKRKRKSFRKMEESSYLGFLYEKEDVNTGRIINFDIRMLEESGMSFEAYPGIHASKEEFMPALVLYCQKIKTKYGTVYVEGKQRNVGFHIENCLLETLLSEDTLNLYEAEAVRVLMLHYENLQNLSCGKLTSVVVKDDPENDLQEKNGKKKFNKKNIQDDIRAYLRGNSSYNAVCENINLNNEIAYYCQIVTQADIFKIRYLIDDDGILTLVGSYGEQAFIVPEAYQYTVALYLNNENSKHNYAALRIGNSKEGVHCQISTSLLDGTIGKETFEFMEHFLIKSLCDTVEMVELLGHGIIPKENLDIEKLNMCATEFEDLIEAFPQQNEEVLEKRDSLDMEKELLRL